MRPSAEKIPMAASELAGQCGLQGHARLLHGVVDVKVSEAVLSAARPQ